MSRLADEMLRQYTAARKGMTDAEADALEAQARELASAILNSNEVTLANRVTAGDRLMLAHAVELARALTKQPEPEVPTIAEPSGPPQLVLHRGQGGRRVGQRDGNP